MPLLTPALALTAALGAQETSDTRGAALLEGSLDEATPAYARRYALLIGIDEYEDAGYPDLSYAVADARAVAKTLVEFAPAICLGTAINACLIGGILLLDANYLDTAVRVSQKVYEQAQRIKKSGGVSPKLTAKSMRPPLPRN